MVDGPVIKAWKGVLSRACRKMHLDHSKKNYPCCCGTDERADVDWDKIGLAESHAYTLVYILLI
jgi:hypothetical protein